MSSSIRDKINETKQHATDKVINHGGQYILNCDW